MVGFIAHAFLILEDGTTFTGSGFGYTSEVRGEVVFNTGMVGYPETLTDPSNSGQILVQTYPLIGNYGIASRSLKEHSLPLHFESDKIQVAGLVVHRLSEKMSNWTAKKSLNDWLLEQRIPGIEGIDTRMLTRKLREDGVMLGILKVCEGDIDIEEYRTKVKNIQNPVKNVTIDKPLEYLNNNSPIVVVVDCGANFGTIRNLLSRSIDVIRVPFDYSLDKIISYDPSGILISSGPGNPKECKKTIETLKELLETDIPIMGLSLGSQLIALAADANTYKLKFGHRGLGYPCANLKTKKCFITSQNHGFGIDEKSLKETSFKLSFINVNDKTVEGIEHKKKSIIGIQFFPDYYETRFLFDEFIKKVRDYEN